MQFRLFLSAAQRMIARWFIQRNIIIVSKHKVRHLTIGAGAQFCLVALMMVSFSWASYSTGSYLAARHALKEQGQALRSVTSAKADLINPAFKHAPAQDDMEEPVFVEPMFTLSALSENKMAAKVALLEKRISELQNANEEIVQRVRDKTAGRIDDLENIIRQTGLNLQTLKKQYGDNNKAAKPKAQGGPYIPDDLSKLVPDADEMLSGLDQLALMQGLVETLPLARPIAGGSEESSFGHRVDPFTGHLAFHSGLDIAGIYGAKILATADGKITAAGYNGAYGNAVDIAHNYGLTTRYGHMSAILVQDGQQVKKGDVIGIQGSTGRSTGQHVHYEVRYRDTPMNPKNFLNAGRNVQEN